jgi:hypothetical protein
MRAVRLDSRLRRLEADVPAGCPACRHRRGRELLHIFRQNPDATRSSVTGEPQPCERCGDVPEEVIELVEVVVSTREEWKRVRANLRCGGGS